MLLDEDVRLGRLRNPLDAYQNIHLTLQFERDINSQIPSTDIQTITNDQILKTKDISGIDY
jgi:hypothetical protein